MKKIWGKRIGTGVLAISLMLSSLPTQLSIALPHKAKAADTEFKSEAFDYGKLPDSTAAKITRKSLTGREWTGEDNNLDITSVNTLPDSSNLVPYADIASAYAGAKDYARDKSSYYQLLTGEGQDWDLTVFDNPAKAEAAGGIILILIGLKILFEHLGLFPFV